MSIMAYLQITYLIINLVGIIVNLFFLAGDMTDSTVVSTVFSFISKYLGNISLALISILLIVLFLPTLTMIAAFFAFISMWGTYSH